MANNTTHTQGMPGRFEGYSFSINPQVGFGSNGEDKHHMAAALEMLGQLVDGDRVTEADDQALAACEFLAKYVREEC